MTSYLLVVAVALVLGWWLLWELPARRSARRAVAPIRNQAKAWLAEEAKQATDNPENAP